jgi:hypothetical protein
VVTVQSPHKTAKGAHPLCFFTAPW